MSTRFDYVVVGAGSAGCVLASRLSEDPGVRVLLLEAGSSDTHMNVKIPAAFSKLFRTERDWDYSSGPEPHLAGRSLYMPRGRMLGGSSSMNAMIYIRGRRHDYDTWESMGATGWGFDAVLPYFKRAEDNERGASEYHAVGGPLRVADLRSPNELSRRFVDGAAAVGIDHNDDFNGAEQDGAGLYQVTQRNGRRWSAADAYLRRAAKRPNLTVQTGALVSRVVFEGNRAVGVEYVLDGAGALARAGREVVLSGGAINSPQLLMLSGVGPADHLREHAIDVVVDNPNVGAHFHDHPVTFLVWRSTRPGSLYEAEKPASLASYVARRKGLLTSNVGEAGGFVRTRPDLPAADIQYHFAPGYFVDHGFETYEGDAFTLGPTLLTPHSRGTVRLRSASPEAHPQIVGNFLDHPEDVAALLAGIRQGREIVASAAFSDTVGEEIYPGSGLQSDAELEGYVRGTLELLYHPAGTCRMGAEPDSVVDPHLRVHGVEGLRVVDASVMPMVVGGNTNAPTIMIAEKAADLIGEV